MNKKLNKLTMDKELQKILSLKAPLSLRGLRYMDAIPPRHSSLTDYIDNRLGYGKKAMAKVDKAISRYSLGAVNKVLLDHYGTILPLIRHDGQTVGGNVLYYDIGIGKVLWKEEITDSLYNWYSYDYYTEAGTFFGEHLVTLNRIAVVQDELTAVLGSISNPDITWLAVGYGRNLTGNMMDKLSGRRVILFANDYNRDFWQEQFGKKYKVDDTFSRMDMNSYLADNILRQT
jgi:hypothetical protein